MDHAALIDAECERLLEWTRDDLATLRGARIFITGGTGFVGRWLVASLLHADRRLDLGLKLVLLTQSPPRFSAEVPWLANHPAVTMWTGDVRTFTPPDGTFTHIIHASGPVATITRARPLESISICIDGTRRLFDFMIGRGIQSCLFISSGSIYGRLGGGAERFTEDLPGSFDPLDPALASQEAKRLCEQFCAQYGQRVGSPRIPIARLFAFYGPWLPDNANYAMDGFVRDAHRGGPVRVQGDGKAVRSYLYAADMTAWVWAVFVRGRHLRAYNVGGEDGLSIGEWAQRVANGRCPVEILGRSVPGSAPSVYLPDVSRAHSELGLRTFTPFADGLQRTLEWAALGTAPKSPTAVPQK